MTDSFVFYKSFYEALKFLDPETKCKAYDAICDYAFDGILPTGCGMERAVFELVKPQIDANNRRRANGAKGAEYGKLGGRPKKTPTKPQNNPKETPRKPLTNPTQTPNVNVNDNVNVNVNDNANENVNVNKSPKGDKRYFPDDDLLEKTFADFQDMRKKIKKPMTDRAISLMLNKLEKLSSDPLVQVKILEQSIMNCWQDIYEIKDVRNDNRSNVQSIMDRWANVH